MKKKGTFEKKLKAYSAVAAGSLLLAPSANAAVQYSGLQNIDLNFGNQSYSLDINSDGVTNFYFGVNTTNTTTATRVWIYPSSANAYWIDDGATYFDPARLSANYLVQNTLLNPATYSWDNESYDTLASTSIFSTSGMFNNRTGCIGVRFFDVTGAQRYGWVQFSGTSIQGVSATGRIIDWAYEDQGAPILTGAGGPLGTCSPPAPTVSVPTLNQWGLFALIALLAGAGVTVLRKQEKA